MKAQHNWRLIGGVAVAAVAIVVVANSGSLLNPGFDAQFIILPNGQQAYCNRQGYRQASAGRGAALVKDTSENFVTCDPKVGPPWDPNRVDGNGDLITTEQHQANLRQKRDEELAQLAATRDQRMEQRRQEIQEELRQQQIEDERCEHIACPGRYSMDVADPTIPTTIEPTVKGAQ